MKAVPRNLFWLGSCLLGSVAALIVGLPFVSSTVFDGWVALAERLNPGVDAPDNWALGLTYCWRTAMGVAFLAVACGLVAILHSRSGGDKGAGDEADKARGDPGQGVATGGRR
jgi:hypothetical protein